MQLSGAGVERVSNEAGDDATVGSDRPSNGLVSPEAGFPADELRPPPEVFEYGAPMRTQVSKSPITESAKAA